MEYMEWLEHEADQARYDERVQYGAERVRGKVPTKSEKYKEQAFLLTLLNERWRRRYEMLQQVGCCGCRDAYGECRLTKMTCRVVLQAGAILRGFKRR